MMVAPSAEAEWALTEFGGAELGDARRTARLVELARVLGSRPQASLPQACEDAARLKAAYRFFANDAVAPEAIVASHVQATLARVETVERVLAVQDTTQLDWSAHPATTGLGMLSTEQQRGLLVHTTLALTPERVPLGLLAQQTWTRPPAEAGKKHTRRERAITAKESYKWLQSVQAVSAAKAVCPHTHIISVGDAEADVYDLFLLERPAGVDLLVRAAQDRRLAEPQTARLRAALAASPVATTVTLEVPRQGTRPARTATLAVHWQPVVLRPPKARAAEDLPPVAVGAVWATEVDAPAGVEPLDWLLLTTVPLHTTDDALQCLTWYACRWGIEVYHKVLKSGCAIERRQLQDVAHLQRCLVVFSVIAWRVLYATMLARVLPDAPCTALLEEDEWQALYCHIQQTTQLPSTPPTLVQAVRWIAQLGGFLGRTRDGAPGVTVLWRGFQRLIDLTAMYRVFRPPPHPRDVGKD